MQSCEYVEADVRRRVSRPCGRLCRSHRCQVQQAFSRGDTSPLLAFSTQLSNSSVRLERPTCDPRRPRLAVRGGLRLCFLFQLKSYIERCQGISWCPKCV